MKFLLVLVPFTICCFVLAFCIKTTRKFLLKQQWKLEKFEGLNWAIGEELQNKTTFRENSEAQKGFIVDLEKQGTEEELGSVLG